MYIFKVAEWLAMSLMQKITLQTSVTGIMLSVCSYIVIMPAISMQFEVLMLQEVSSLVSEDASFW